MKPMRILGIDPGYATTGFGLLESGGVGLRLLQYGVQDARQDLCFCLYDNVWNTNFPMWYSDDGLFRFEVEKR